MIKIYKKLKNNPTALVIMSVSSLLLGGSGINRLMNNQGLFDILIGLPLAITGLVGGFLGLRAYNKMKDREDEENRNNS